MDVGEQAEEITTLERAGPPPPPPLPLPTPPEKPVLNPALLRLAYTFEFWIVLLTIYTVWSQVGGQGHLDLIAWYIKLACGVAVAWCSLRMTKGMVENARAWNRVSVRWFLAVLVLVAIAASITYWYHLHEVPEEPGTDENSAISVRSGVAERGFQRVSSGPDGEKAGIRAQIRGTNRMLAVARS